MARRLDGLPVWMPQVCVSAMLAWALYPENPYGYYVLLRWACCGGFGFLALRAYELGSQDWAWILGTTALIYNPVAPLHLGREIWSIVNLLSIAVALGSIRALNRRGA